MQLRKEAYFHEWLAHVPLAFVQQLLSVLSPFMSHTVLVLMIYEIDHI